MSPARELINPRINQMGPLSRKFAGAKISRFTIAKILFRQITHSKNTHAKRQENTLKKTRMAWASITQSWWQSQGYNLQQSWFLNILQVLPAICASYISIGNTRIFQKLTSKYFTVCSADYFSCNIYIGIAILTECKYQCFFFVI